MKHAHLKSLLVATALSSAMSAACAATPRVSAPQQPFASTIPAACPAAPRGGRTVVGLQVIGLTADGRLTCFRERSPGAAVSLGFVSGLVTDTSLVGIDYRVQDNLLYGVGNAGGVYTINTGTGAATLVNRLSVALEGTAFGVDFNPAADRLRIISNTGQNLRHNVNSGGVTIADTVLTVPPATTAATSVVGAAYTNNDLDPLTATSIYDINTAADQVVLQSPANNGLLAATGALTVDATAAAMDIYSVLGTTATVENRALATLTPAGGSAGLYGIELTTGKAVLRGAFAAENAAIDIAIPLDQP